MSHPYTGILNTFYDELKSRVVISKQSEAEDINKWFADNSIICKCSLCNNKDDTFTEQRKQSHKTSIIKFCDYLINNTQQKDFEWIIQHLISPTNDFKGCEINFPECVFFSKSGKPSFMVKNDKDGWLTAITQESSLQIYKIRRNLANTIRNRK